MDQVDQELLEIAKKLARLDYHENENVNENAGENANGEGVVA